MTGRRILVDDRMQHGYTYEITAAAGRDFHSDFRPDPAALGVRLTEGLTG